MKLKIKSPFVVPARLHALLVIAGALKGAGIEIRPCRVPSQPGPGWYGYCIVSFDPKTGIHRYARHTGWTFADAVQEAVLWLVL